MKWCAVHLTINIIGPMNDSPLKNWIPYKMANPDGKTLCRWLNTYGSTFTEPFFESTILKCRVMDKQHARVASVSDLGMMQQWAAKMDALEPAAFIFHISRCGSTLVSQLLASSENHIVLSEVPFFDDILRLPFKDASFDHTQTSALLAAAVKFYGQKKSINEKRLFIKTDSWHIFFYKQIRALYPNVPFILIYRSPDEVFSSHRKMPGMQAVPGLIEPQLFGFAAEEIDYNRLDLYLANVLETYFKQYLQIIETDHRSVLINYSEGPMPVIQKIAAHVNLTFSEADLMKMTERSRFHSKKPGERFHEEHILLTNPMLNEAMKLYKALEKKRIDTAGAIEQ